MSDPSGADLTLAFLLLLLLQSFSRLSIKQLYFHSTAFQSTFHTSSEKGQHQGSSGDDKYNDKDKYRKKYKDKDKVQKIQDMYNIFEKKTDIKYDILSSAQ